MPRSIDRFGKEIGSPREADSFVLGKGDFVRLDRNSPYYLLRQGKVMAYSNDPKFCSGLYTPDSISGEPLRKRTHQYAGKLIAVSEATFRIIPRDQKLDPESGALLIKASDHDKQIHLDRIALLTQGNVRQKIAWALLALTNRADRDIPVTQQAIADISSASRVTVNTTLRGLEAEGVLANHATNYMIKGPNGVERLEELVSMIHTNLVPKD